MRKQLVRFCWAVASAALAASLGATAARAGLGTPTVFTDPVGDVAGLDLGQVAPVADLLAVVGGDQARTEEEEELLGVAGQEDTLLSEIDRALGKMDKGAYGVSEASGRPIPLERPESCNRAFVHLLL